MKKHIIKNLIKEIKKEEPSVYIGLDIKNHEPIKLNKYSSENDSTNNIFTGTVGAGMSFYSVAKLLKNNQKEG